MKKNWGRVKILGAKLKTNSFKYPPREENRQKSGGDEIHTKMISKNRGGRIEIFVTGKFFCFKSLDLWMALLWSWWSRRPTRMMGLL